MVRIDAIYLAIEKKSILTPEELKNVFSKTFKKVVSHTNFRIDSGTEGLKVILKKPISLLTMDQIFKVFQKRRIKLKNFNWEEIKVGNDKVGIMRIVPFG